MSARNTGFPFLLISICMLSLPFGSARSDDHHSVARVWNETLLHAIRQDFARPTVHARNLFHASAAMYDAWAAFNPPASPYFLGRTQANGFQCSFSEAERTVLTESAATDEERQSHIELALSVAMYHLLNHRFENSPGSFFIRNRINTTLDDLGITISDEAAPQDNTPEALGNSIAQCIIDYGLTDGSNESNQYTNQYYQPANDPINPTTTGNPSLQNPDRWQPLLLNAFIDQSGNPIAAPEFLGAEWGNVEPFALNTQDSAIMQRAENSYRLYLDQGAPALFATDAANYAWGHSLVAAWSSHLDPTDGVEWDISPASIGASAPLPDITLDGLQTFYQYKDGGALQEGHSVNPVTGQDYAASTALRGDYTRVVAEYWADGPDSETPPGHWFTLLNDHVLDHPDFERRINGTGALVDALEFDIRSYFLLGGAMHDAAIAAWSHKGWYDYIRPVSALRFLAALGQSSDATLPSYNAQGIPLLAGVIEVVLNDDPLAATNAANIGKIKVRAWRGPAAISNTATDTAGVDWILLENWWPYQRPTFVTPPFAGYVSGHSTFSRAAAEVLASLTGSEYFPGGIAEFVAPQNDFLVFEQGPSQDVTLQWATFRDASDQSSLSRIWGGIHPPVDDIPGRKLGIQVASRAVERAESFFAGNLISNGSNSSNSENGERGGRLFSGCSVISNQNHTPINLWLYLLLVLLVSATVRRRAMKKQEDSALTTD